MSEGGGISEYIKRMNEHIDEMQRILNGGQAAVGISQAIDENPLYEGLLLLEPRDEYDKCVLGVVRRFSSSFVLYSKRCVLEAVAAGIEDEEYGDRYEQAVEHFEFNMAGAWVGDATPGYLEDVEE